MNLKSAMLIILGIVASDNAFSMGLAIDTEASFNHQIDPAVNQAGYALEISFTNLLPWTVTPEIFVQQDQYKIKWLDAQTNYVDVKVGGGMRIYPASWNYLHGFWGKLTRQEKDEETHFTTTVKGSIYGLGVGVLWPLVSVLNLNMSVDFYHDDAFKSSVIASHVGISAMW